MDKDTIEDILKQVIDPDLGTDIISLKLVTKIEYNNQLKEVSFLFRPASFTCPLAYSLGLQVKDILLNHPGIDRIKVTVENFIKKTDLENLLNQP